MGRGKGGSSPNDQRSNSLNPNNPAFAASQANRAVQLNPTSPAYRSSRQDSDEDGSTSNSEK